MKRKEKDLLFAYLYNNYSRMQREVRQMQFNIRYRDIDEIDCNELLIATAQLNLFRQVYSDIIALLKLSKLEGEGGKNED